jgi:hypothetical protein
MLVFSEINIVSETVEPFVPPLHVATMFPTGSARPSACTVLEVELSTHETVCAARFAEKRINSENTARAELLRGINEAMIAYLN